MVKLFGGGMSKADKLRLQIANLQEDILEANEKTASIIEQNNQNAIDAGVGGVAYGDMSSQQLVDEREKRNLEDEMEQRKRLAARLRARTMGGSKLLMAPGANQNFSPFSAARQTTGTQTSVNRNPRSST